MRFLITAALLILPVAGAPLYGIRHVGPWDGVATAVGSSGAVSGYVVDERGVRSAFVFDGANLSLLASGTAAEDSNGAGLTVGTVWTAEGPRAALWNNGAAQILDLIDSYALAVNELGDIAGSAGGRAFVRTSSGLHMIGSGAWSAAYDLSDGGQAAGTYQDSRGRFRAFTWTESGGTVALGTLGGSQSWAQAVNERGMVAGASLTARGYLHAFLYAGGMTDLGTLGGTMSAAYDVNGSGHAVGYSHDAQGNSRAFLWRDGKMLDLNSLIDPAEGWTLEAAYGINGKGQIAGTGTLNGVRAAFLLNPAMVGEGPSAAFPLERAGGDVFRDNGPADASIPEPGTFGMMALAAAGGVVALRRRL